jgi:hypothetical protein
MHNFILSITLEKLYAMVISEKHEQGGLKKNLPCYLFSVEGWLTHFYHSVLNPAKGVRLFRPSQLLITEQSFPYLVC